MPLQTGTYWAGRADEHRTRAQELRAEASDTADPDDRRSLELAAIDRDILAEACERNAQIYD